jgi:hypothetical protein
LCDGEKRSHVSVNFRKSDVCRGYGGGRAAEPITASVYQAEKFDSCGLVKKRNEVEQRGKYPCLSSVVCFSRRYESENATSAQLIRPSCFICSSVER